MRERGEVAARPTEPRAGTNGTIPRPEHGEQQLDRLDARTRVALRDRVRAQQHRRAHDLVGVRLADAARVAAEQAQLQLLGLLVGDRLRDEAAEAGVDAVGVLAAERRRGAPASASSARPRWSASAASRPAIATSQTSSTVRSSPVSSSSTVAVSWVSMAAASLTELRVRSGGPDDGSAGAIRRVQGRIQRARPHQASRQAAVADPPSSTSSSAVLEPEQRGSRPRLRQQADELAGADLDPALSGDLAHARDDVGEAALPRRRSR